MNKTLGIIAAVTILLAFSLIFTIGWWLFYPYRIITFEGNPKIINPVVKAGTIVKYNISYCKYMNLGATVTTAFVNDLIYTIPPTETNNLIGCHTKTFSTLIPKELPEGTYFIQKLYRYKINPIRDIDIKTKTETFQVKGGD
jgi:hypothetical protein